MVDTQYEKVARSACEHPKHASKFCQRQNSFFYQEGHFKMPLIHPYSPQKVTDSTKEKGKINQTSLTKDARTNLKTQIQVRRRKMRRSKITRQKLKLPSTIPNLTTTSTVMSSCSAATMKISSCMILIGLHRQVPLRLTGTVCKFIYFPCSSVHLQ